ncbi:methyltransferase domain-containing protein [bacterium]|nr:methyltransferase domain-containing protein [bacterium]
MPVEQTRAEVAFLLARLQPGKGRRWLDLPCAYGRHLEEIHAVRPDLRLVGGDLNPEYLIPIRRKKIAAAMCCDMRRVPSGDASFDAVLNLLNNFGYFEYGTDGDRRALAEMARVLKPGGRLVMDLPNRRALIATVRREPVIRYANAQYEAIEEFRWDAPTQTVHNRTRWRWPGGREQAGYKLRLYTPAQIRRMLERAGFTIERTFGDFTGRAFDAHESDRLLIFAKRTERTKRT